MRVLLSWLKNFVDISRSPSELAAAFTMAGLEVERLEEIPRDFSGVVAGRVLSCEPHPKADKLQVCRVDAGGKPYTVVCGAANVKAGIMAPLAPPGALLMGQKLEAREIRGVHSDGMLCSEAELGLTDRAEGLMILDPSVAAGTDLKGHLGETDYVFDIFITPNRPDCLSVLGLAREVSAFTGTTLKKRPASGPCSSIAAENPLRVEIQDTAHCYRYSGQMLKNIRLESSPFWLAYRLHHAGLRAINNVVDVTNYVMLEMGHPMHAFDRRQLEGDRIIVRAAEEGETFTTLDGKQRTLDAESCLICDTAKPVALAGIMGGLNSEVLEDTSTVFLESAYFEPTNIRRTAKRLDIATESSRRFERGADPNGTLAALDMAARMLAELAGAEPVGGIVDVHPHPVAPMSIPFSIERCQTLLGTPINTDEALALLSRLEIVQRPESSSAMALEIPTFRPDLTRPVDLIEEIARLYGYDRIPFAHQAVVDQTQVRNERIDFTDRVRRILAGLGLHETLSLSLVPQPIAAKFLAAGEKPVELLNPLSTDWAVFRTSLLISLLQNTAYNRNRQMQNLRLFEIGRVAWWDDKSSGHVERQQLAAILAGKRGEPAWYESAGGFDFYDIKGLVTALLTQIGIRDFRLVPAVGGWWDQESSGLALGQGTCIGGFGKLNRDIASEFKIKIDDLYAFYLDFDQLYAARPAGTIFQPIAKYPSVPFDLALLLDANTPVGEVTSSIRAAGGTHLAQVTLFDFYKGEQIPPGKKSVAFSLTFTSRDRTLDVADVEDAIADILNQLKRQFGAELRPR